MCGVEIEDILQCRGQTSIPDTWKELVENRILDNWNTNIKCVMSGKKHVAVTDYDSLEDPDDVSSYYDMFGGIQLHIELLDQAEKMRGFILC